MWLLSLPFWLLSVIVDSLLLPGLPVSAAMVVCPAVAGAVLSLNDGGATEVKRFFRQVRDFRPIRLEIWALASMIMPTAAFLSWMFLVMADQPPPDFEGSIAQVLVLMIVFLAAATLEELGWTGYATRKLLSTRSIFTTSLIVGAVGIAWHMVPLLQADRDSGWIAWWALGTLAGRYLIVGLFAWSGECLGVAILFHSMSNLSWMLFPVLGSHYDPKSMGMILLAFAAIAYGTLWRDQR